MTTITFINPYFGSDLASVRYLCPLGILNIMQLFKIYFALIYDFLLTDENRDINIHHIDDDIKRQRIQYNGDQIYPNVSHKTVFLFKLRTHFIFSVHRFGQRSGVSKMNQSNSSNSPQIWQAVQSSRYQHPLITITTITRPTIATHQITHRQRTARTMDPVTTIHHITILIMCSRHRSTIITIRTQYSITIASRQYPRLKTRYMRRQLEHQSVSSKFI